jgi:hypothetical protein
METFKGGAMKLRNYRVVISIALVLTGLILMAEPEAGRDLKLSQAEVVELVREDPAVLWKKSMRRFVLTADDYTGVLYKQERIKGKLGKEQVVEFKFRERPYSIFMRWIKNPGKIDKLLYIEKQNENKMLLHPAGLLGFIKSIEKDPYDKEVLKSTRKPCTEFGLLKVMQGLAEEYELDEGRSKITTKFIRQFEEGKREYVLLEQIYDNPEKGEVAKRVITYDVKMMLPTQRQVYDSQNNLLYKYSYTNLKFNRGLTDKDFSAKYNGLK